MTPSTPVICSKLPKQHLLSLCGCVSSNTFQPLQIYTVGVVRIYTISAVGIYTVGVVEISIVGVVRIYTVGVVGIYTVGVVGIYTVGAVGIYTVDVVRIYTVGVVGAAALLSASSRSVLMRAQILRAGPSLMFMLVMRWSSFSSSKA